MSQLNQEDERDVSLPAGCSDLIDILKLQPDQKPEHSPVPSEAEFVLRQAQFESNGLAFLGQFISTFLDYPGEYFCLAIARPGTQSDVWLRMSCGAERVISINVRVETINQRMAAQTFFRSRGLRNASEAGLCIVGDDGWPELTFVLPLDHERIVNIVTSLFIEVLEVPGDAGLSYLCYGDNDLVK